MLNISLQGIKQLFQRLRFLSNALSFSQLVKKPNKFTGRLNTKSFHSMHIMWKLPTNKANFLFKNTQDFNHTAHAAPHLPIVFIDNMILYFNYLVFVPHVFKRSCNGTSQVVSDFRCFGQNAGLFTCFLFHHCFPIWLMAARFTFGSVSILLLFQILISYINSLYAKM